MRIDIRPAVSSDIPAIAEIIDEVWRQDYKNLLDEKLTLSFCGKRRIDSITALQNAGADIFVLECDKTICAVCTTIRCEQRRYECYAEIVQLYVRTDCRKIGLGRKLLSHTLRKMREKGYKNAILKSLSENKTAGRFYEKFGFQPVGTAQSDKLPGAELTLYTIEL